MHPCESIELECWADLLSVPAAREAGAVVRRLGPGAVFTTPTVDHVMFNRSIGVSGTRLLDAVRDLDRTGNRYFVHQHPHELQATRPLGLEPYPRSWVKLVRDMAIPVEAAASDVPIRAALPSDAGSMAQLFCDAFDIPASGVEVIAGIVGRPRWHVSVVEDGGRVVALGLLFVDGEVGYLAGGATARSHRRRGIQRALVQHRIHQARDLGVGLLCTETGEEKVGEPQHSFRNLVRSGFEPSGVRHNLCRPGTSWS